MVNITLSISPQLKDKMDRLPSVRWSQVARNAIQNHIDIFEKVESIAQKSKLTEKDAKKIASIIKKDSFKKMLNEYNNR